MLCAQRNIRWLPLQVSSKGRMKRKGARDRHRLDGVGPLDAIDRALVVRLQSDGRRPYVELAKSVRLSEAAVRRRVQRMLKDGVMQVVAVTDPMAMGFHRVCMVGVKTEGEVMRAAKALAALAQVHYVVISAGAFDLLVELVCEDDAQLLAILNKIRTFPGVRDTETFVYLNLYKQTYAWGSG
jgi:Lrp/AsnC family transcriptional regulator, regulator for asnA, asnC and gidA